MFRYFFLLALLCSQITWAQVQVISIDTALGKNSQRSLGFALGASALLPGMGEYYLDMPNRAKYFLWTEVAAWGVALASYSFGEGYLSTGRSHAIRYAGAINPPRDKDFLDLMANFQSRAGNSSTNYSPENDEDYNQMMIRAGLDVDVDYPNTEKYSWDWGATDDPSSTANRNQLKDILRSYRKSRIIMQSALGVMVLNRLISMVDVIQIFRATGVSGLTMKAVPYLDGYRTGGTLLLQF